ncbi:MAG: PAS domain S-box protein [Planctomycetales bacterium]|nr:PAS domain S-box protein [Planctomycetales bacterium]
MNNTLALSMHRILLVDDNPAIHGDYRKILEFNSGNSELDELSSLMFDDDASPAPTLPAFEIDSAMQGQEAFDMTQAALSEGRPYALAFVDMRMPPGWDGLETIDHLWKIDPNLQVVICTAFSDYSWSEIVDRLTYRDRLLLLKKPFDNIEVCQLAIALTSKWELEQHAKSQLNAILETVADGIITTREGWVVDSCNQAACRLFGYECGELQGMSFDDLLSESNDDNARSDSSVDLSASVSNSSAVNYQQREAGGCRKDGSLVPIQLSISDFSGWDGARHVIVVKDLSELNEPQDALAESRSL